MARTKRSARLTVFVSSTVEDLGAVREEIGTQLESRGFDVLMSERPDFPVAPGVTSHDACLAAIRHADVFVLLVGQRFGGEYQGQAKSITWREWEEALRYGLLMIVLVEKRTNDLCREIFRKRKDLRKQHVASGLKNERKIASKVDRQLSADYPDFPPYRQKLPDVQRFVDELLRLMQFVSSNSD